MDKLYVIIPAFNDQDTVEQVARQWNEVVLRTGPNSRMVFFNDGSTDETYQRLIELERSIPQMIVIHREHSGHGAAVLAGYRYALSRKAKYIFQTDSHGQTLPQEFWQMWSERESYDIQIGYRKDRQDGFGRMLVTRMLKLAVFFAFGMRVTDANTPFRLMSAKSLEQHIEDVPPHFYMPNVLLTVLYQKAKAKMRYVDITYKSRQKGNSEATLWYILSTGLRALRDFSAVRKKIIEQKPHY